MNSRMTLAIGGVLLLAASISGCSGGSGMNSYSSPSSPTATPTVTPTPTPTPTPAPDPAPTPAPTPGPSATNVEIEIVGMNGDLSYSPNPVSVEVGQTVSWKNADSLPHTATADGGAFNTGTLAAGATSKPITMTTAGTFPYHCAIHGFSMTGTLTVTAAGNDQYAR
jgi:plastocyanin